MMKKLIVAGFLFFISSLVVDAQDQGDPIGVECPPGTIFNVCTQQCDFEENVSDECREFVGTCSSGQLGGYCYKTERMVESFGRYCMEFYTCDFTGILQMYCRPGQRKIYC